MPVLLGGLRRKIMREATAAMTERTYEVQFTVEEHPDTECEITTVKDADVGGAIPPEQAVVAAAGDSPYTHVETVAIREVTDG